MTRLASVSQNLRDVDFVQNPYSFYTIARAAGPLVWWQELHRPAATTHEAVNTILRDRRFGRARPPGMEAEVPDHLARFHAVEEFSLLELDGSDHAQIRKRVMRAFTTARIIGLAPEIARLATELADRIEVGDDLLPAFATPIPLTVISRLLGVPDADGQNLLDWSHAMCRMYVANPPIEHQEAANTAAQEFADYLAEVMKTKRRAPGNDLASAMIEDGRMSQAQMTSTLVLLLNAGHEATVHALGNAIRLLTGKPDHCAPEAVAGTVEEVLRFDPPLHLFDRVAQEDCTLFGHDFSKGDSVACLLGAANRDPSMFDEPARFDPGRDARAHVAFGAGAHFCLGAPLARLEMQIALRELFARHPDLRVEAGPYTDAWHFHGLERLTVTAL